MHNGFALHWREYSSLPLFFFLVIKWYCNCRWIQGIVAMHYCDGCSVVHNFSVLHHLVPPPTASETCFFGCIVYYPKLLLHLQYLYVEYYQTTWVKWIQLLQKSSFNVLIWNTNTCFSYFCLTYCCLIF